MDAFCRFMFCCVAFDGVPFFVLSDVIDEPPCPEKIPRRSRLCESFSRGGSKARPTNVLNDL